jgi:hypothetical protein
MTVEEAVEFVIEQEAKLAGSRARKASMAGDDAKVTPLAELIALMSKYSEEELPQTEKFNIMRDVRDGKKDIRVAMRTVKAIRRRSLHEARPPRPQKPARPAGPKARPARPSVSLASSSPTAQPGPPTRPPRPSAKGDAAAAGGAATRARPPRPSVAGDDSSVLSDDGFSASAEAGAAADPYASGDDSNEGDDSASGSPTGAAEDVRGGVAPQVGVVIQMTAAEREARYAAMAATTTGEGDDRDGKSKIWKALNPQRLWEGDDASGDKVFVSGSSVGFSSDGPDEVASDEVDGAVEDARAALDAIQAFDDEGGGEFADLSESEDDDDDDEDDIVIDDDELMQMIEAKRKERGVMSRSGRKS